MTPEQRQMRARLGAYARHARRTQAEINADMAKVRDAQRVKREAEVVARYGLDPSMPDYEVRLRRGMAEYQERMRLAKAMKRRAS